MKRSEHMFQFRGDKISEAAQAEYEYHTARIAFWKDEREKAVTAAKEKGLEVREYQVTGGTRTEMIIDPSLQTRINEAGSKVYSHQQSADGFQIEAAAYGTPGNRERVYELQPDDVKYFRLAGGPRVE